jgi:hypothetical protein
MCIILFNKHNAQFQKTYDNFPQLIFKCLDFITNDKDWHSRLINVVFNVTTSFLNKNKQCLYKSSNLLTVSAYISSFANQPVINFNNTQFQLEISKNPLVKKFQLSIELSIECCNMNFKNDEELKLYVDILFH